MEITIRDFIAAVRKNGLEQAFGGLFQYRGVTGEYNHLPGEGDKIYAACAFGQALINLNAYTDIYVFVDGVVETLYYKVWSANDKRMMAPADIADYLEEIYEDRLDEVLNGFEPFDYTPYLVEKVDV